MRAAGVFVLLVVAACGGGGTPIGEGDGGEPAWLRRVAAPGPAELSQVLGMSHAATWRRLGPHTLRARAKLRVVVPDQPPDELEDEYLLEAGSAGQFHALHHNSRDQGVELYLLKGDLFIRLRYGQFVRRRPEEGEADRARESVFGALAADHELLGRFMSARPEGRPATAGRPALRLRLAAAASPRPLAPEEGPRAWRSTIAVRALSGTVDVDAATGVPLAATLAATFTFRRGDRVATVELAHESTITPGVPSLVAPEAIPGPTRLRYHVERQQLLEGLVPPGAGAP